ncbi:hypothetical protein BS47DRAFT_532163 [Hydnum rufescens UP504]|uniref:Uncharacterized protein n=1 Tax=Hydnum rufescens UP504 TaxID=1448309 RepID=A0A9P6B482_9AGAM|nr:hypothetical protein BS47DRAFT_532163 [Hydnum rufescens UP504]
MSKGELDADLYGDLYGADDAEYNNDFEEPSTSTNQPAAAAKTPSEPVKSTKDINLAKPATAVAAPAASTALGTSPKQATAAAATAAPKAAPVPPRVEGTSSIPVFTDEGQTGGGSSAGGRPQTSYSSQIAQQFSQYSQMPGQERGGYAGREERSIRPSEMRDEG